MPRVPLRDIKPTPPRPVIYPSELDFSERDVGWAPVVSYPKSAPACRGSFGCLPRWFTTSEYRCDSTGLTRGGKVLWLGYVPHHKSKSLGSLSYAAHSHSLIACERGRVAFVLLMSWRKRASNRIQIQCEPSWPAFDLISSR